MKITTLVLTAILAVNSLNAQQAAPAKAEPPAGKAERAAEAGRAYRFLYTLTELSGKQKVNSRSFEILTRDRGEVGTVSHVPVAVGASTSQFHTMDVGLNAQMHFQPAPDNEIYMSIQVSMTFLVAPESTSSTAPPVIRSITMQDDTRVKVGVPTVIGTIEDVASTHSYELSVTVNPK